MTYRPLASLPVLAPLAVACACVSIPSEVDAPKLATHVDDWRNEVIYQVLTDRFADGDVNNDFAVRPGALARFQGGDYKGLEDHLDYFTSLGVTTLWISPIVKNVETDANVDSYHGYWAQDLTELNPHFGDIVALRSLVEHAHAVGMKIVLDIVTNHMGQVFFYDMNLNGVPDENIGGTGTTSPLKRVSEYDPDYDPNGVQASSSAGNAGRAPIIFIHDPTINRVPPRPAILGTRAGYHGKGRTLNYDIDEQRLTGDFPGGLKDVATENPDVRAAMIDAYAHWAEALDLDGFRIDTVKHVEHEFWTTFAKGVRERLARQGKKKFLMFGEAFDGNDELLGSYTKKGELDSVFYFSQHFQVVRDVFEYAHDPGMQKGTKQIQDLWDARKTHYGDTPQEGGAGVSPQKLLVNFLDNHDVARFLFDAAGDKDALRNSLTLLFTEDGMPCVYYGTEQEFSGGNDPANREVIWPTRYATNGDTFTHIAKLARLRKEHEALRKGDTTVVWATEHTHDESDAGMFAFERTGGDTRDYALVVLNTNAKKKSQTGNAGASMKITKQGKLRDVLGSADAIQAGTDGSVMVSLPPQSAAIFVP